MEAEQRDAVARGLDQLGLYPCKGRPYMPLLVTAVVHKVCRVTMIEIPCVRCPQERCACQWRLIIITIYRFPAMLGTY